MSLIRGIRCWSINSPRRKRIKGGADVGVQITSLTESQPDAYSNLEGSFFAIESVERSVKRIPLRSSRSPQNGYKEKGADESSQSQLAIFGETEQREEVWLELTKNL